MSTVPIPTPRPTIKVTLVKTVDLQQLNNIISSITGRLGCRTCGLLGFDLELAGDPGDFGDLSTLPGVKSVGYE